MKDKADILARLVVSYMTYKPANERMEIVANLAEALDGLTGWLLERACTNLMAREQYLPTVAVILREAKEQTPAQFVYWRQLQARAQRAGQDAWRGEFDAAAWKELCDDMEWAGMEETATRHRERGERLAWVASAYAREAAHAEPMPF